MNQNKCYERSRNIMIIIDQDNQRIRQVKKKINPKLDKALPALPN